MVYKLIQVVVFNGIFHPDATFLLLDSSHFILGYNEHLTRGTTFI